MNSNSSPKDLTKDLNLSQAEIIELLQRLKTECEKAILSGYEDAQISGLCHEGALEMAVGRLRSLKPEQLIAKWQTESYSQPTNSN
ncbi:MAG: hypothetical protein H3C43_05485 [Leptonema sp. (in: Bacteria)]|nr:hypothetical protein [Leptonema sp. (in: bacteria)]